MNEVRIFPYSARIKGLCKDSKLVIVDIRDSEIYGTRLEVKAVFYHSPPGSA